MFRFLETEFLCTRVLQQTDEQMKEQTNKLTN